jgi:CBS domain containing-hemolysin-like protein
MSEVVLPLLVITVLIVLNGLFVAAEFAIVAARRVRLESGERQGGWAVRYVSRILGSAPLQDRYIAVAQLGITLATIGLGMYGEPSVAGWIDALAGRLGGIGEGTAHSIGTVVAVLVLTYFHVVVGEMIPKALALQEPERVALGVSRPMRVSGILFLPLVALLTAVGNGLLRLFRVPLTGEARLYSPAELSHLVRESQEEGAVSAEEERLISNILEFGEREVRHVMLPRLRVEALALDASWEDVRLALARKRYSRYPVYRTDLDDVVGVLHAKDFIEHDLRLQDGAAGAPDLRSLVRRVPRVPEAMPVERLLAAFKRLHVHMALVVEEHGGTAGVVTLDDLLEEVVGEVAGEPEREEAPEVEPLGDQSYLVDGAMQLHRFNERFETSLAAEESTTIAGFVLERLRRVPQPGEEVLADGLVLRVHELKGLAIARLRVELRRQRGQSKPSEQ